MLENLWCRPSFGEAWPYRNRRAWAPHPPGNAPRTFRGARTRGVWARSDRDGIDWAASG